MIHPAERPRQDWTVVWSKQWDFDQKSLVVRGFWVALGSNFRILSPSGRIIEGEVIFGPLTKNGQGPFLAGVEPKGPLSLGSLVLINGQFINGAIYKLLHL